MHVEAAAAGSPRFPFYSEGAPLKPDEPVDVLVVLREFPLLFGRGSIEARITGATGRPCPRFPFYSEGAPLKHTPCSPRRRRNCMFPLLFGRGSIEAISCA